MSGDIVAELREAQAALARVRALADEWTDPNEWPGGVGMLRDSEGNLRTHEVVYRYENPAKRYGQALREALEPRQTRATAPRSDEQGEEDRPCTE